MSRRKRIAAFEAWLRERGQPDDVALFNRSVVDGFVVLAGAEPVRAEHVDTALRLAREAGLTNVTQLKRLGELYLEHENLRDGAAVPAAAALDHLFATPDFTDPVPASEALDHLLATPESAEPVPTEPVATEPTAGEPADTEPEVAAAPDPAPMFAISDRLPVVNIRATQRQPVTAEVATPDQPEPPTVTRQPRPRWHRRIAAAGVVAALAGLVALERFYPRTVEDEPDVAPAPTVGSASPPVGSASPPVGHKGRLRRVPLTAQFPAGWREASDAELGAVSDPRAPTSLVFRGAAATDPEQGVFIAMVPRPVELDGAPSDEALITATRRAERGILGQLVIDRTSYEPFGCTVISIDGNRAGACRGAAKQDTELALLETYVRVIDGQQVIALFLAKRGVHGAPRDSAAIVASFAP